MIADHCVCKPCPTMADITKPVVEVKTAEKLKTDNLSGLKHPYIQFLKMYNCRKNGDCRI